LAKIVVVEDAPDSLRLFRALLTRNGHEVAELPDGSRLAETVRRFEPDLVLLDIELPDRDGFELLAELRAMDSPPRTIVALTAHGSAADLTRTAQAGFDGHITKPIDIREFPKQLTRFLGAAV